MLSNTFAVQDTFIFRTMKFDNIQTLSKFTDTLKPIVTFKLFCVSQISCCHLFMARTYSLIFIVLPQKEVSDIF